MSSEWITGKSPAGWSRYAIAAAIVAGCSSGSDATDPPNYSPFNQGGYGGYDPNQQGQAAVPQQQQIPPAGPLCGNGMLDQGEQCEGGTTLTCAQATMGSRPNGTVACTNCYIDMNGCTPQYNPPPGGGAPPIGGAPPFGVGGTPPFGAGGSGGEFGAGGAQPGGGAPPVGGASSGGSVSVGPNAPAIPQVTAQCPTFGNSTISFMNSAGIIMVAGAKPPGPTAPMVMYWHGTVTRANEYALMAAAVQQGVVAAGGVLVSPDVSLGGDLRSGTSIWGQADYAMADQMVACAIRDANIDPRRVYTMGCSAGGLFATAYATERSSYVAAAAPNSGGYVAPLTFQTPNFTPALMTVHGAPGSDVVVIDFSQSSNTADKAFKAHGGFVINCNHGGGHCGGSGQAPSVWQFFMAHPYGVSPEPYAGGLPAGFSSVCQIFTG